MHRRKTGALLQASVLMGAACGRPMPAAWQALSDYGAALGLAFQVVDDILDVTQASATLGKTAGKDLDANKPTYVTVLGLDAARRHAAELRQQAHAALARSGLPDAAHRLAGLLADRVVDRPLTCR
jgi:farnesyl diphosphate synthase